MSSEKLHAPPNWLKFALGGVAGMGATVVVQPLDLLKNRMQVAGKGSKEKVSMIKTASNVIRNEGFFAIYNGLSAGLLRQAVYTSTRLGVYNTLFEHFSADGKPPGLLAKASIGVVAGGIGSFIGTPADVALIRMSADGVRPLAERRGYTSVFNALTRIAKEEGVATLWRGWKPTVGRAMIVNAAQLATYSQAKEMLLTTGYFKEGIFLHFNASMVSGLVTTVVSMPVDIVKTRLQNMSYVNGVPEYKGISDVFTSVVRKEGVPALWKGFFPYYSRLGPHTVITFILLEIMNRMYHNNVSGLPLFTDVKIA